MRTKDVRVAPKTSCQRSPSSWSQSRSRRSSILWKTSTARDDRLFRKKEQGDKSCKEEKRSKCLDPSKRAESRKTTSRAEPLRQPPPTNHEEQHFHRTTTEGSCSNRGFPPRHRQSQNGDPPKMIPRDPTACAHHHQALTLLGLLNGTSICSFPL
jgi:hypothetical protein